MRLNLKYQEKLMLHMAGNLAKERKEREDHYEHYGSHFVAGGCGIVYDTALCAERTFETGDVIPCCGDCF